MKGQLRSTFSLFQVLETIPEESGELDLDSLADGLEQEMEARSSTWLVRLQRAIGMMDSMEIRKVAALLPRGRRRSMTTLLRMPRLSVAVTPMRMWRGLLARMAGVRRPLSEEEEKLI